MATIRRTVETIFIATNGITDADSNIFFGSNWGERLQPVVEFGGTREAGGRALNSHALRVKHRLSHTMHAYTHCRSVTRIIRRI